MTQELRLAERRLYTYPEVDWILGLAAGTAQRWINGYRRRDRDYQPVVRDESSDVDRVNWGEFIETYYLSRFRGSGIPMQKMRQILTQVRERTGSRYLFSDDRVLHADPGLLEAIGEAQRIEDFNAFVVVRTGQIGFELEPEARARLERISYEGGIATALRPRMDIEHVVVYADRFFGKPKLEGTGISPDAVARIVVSGTPVENVAEIYDLSRAFVDEAGRFVYGDRWRLVA